jgi:hypothetical protein
MGFRILEIPIIFDDRRFARSKMSYREISGAAAMLARLSVQRLFGPTYQRPNRLGEVLESEIDGP